MGVTLSGYNLGIIKDPWWLLFVWISIVMKKDQITLCQISAKPTYHISNLCETPISI